MSLYALFEVSYSTQKKTAYITQHFTRTHISKNIRTHV